jgi:hypothetical protein
MATFLPRGEPQSRPLRKAGSVLFCDHAEVLDASEIPEKVYQHRYADKDQYITENCVHRALSSGTKILSLQEKSKTHHLKIKKNSRLYNRLILNAIMSCLV